MNFIEIIKILINPLGLDLKKHPNLDLRRRRKLIEHYKINKIIDVGANSGQYATQIVKLGFKGEIFSFEPVASVFEKLNKKTSKNKLWSAYNYGLGNKNEELYINISKNTYSSSFLEIMPTHIEGAPASKYTKKEKVMIKTLDKIFFEIADKKDEVFLKIDAQGFEKKVIEGAKESLKHIRGIQLEMSLEELYKGEMLFEAAIKLLSSLGFSLHSLENGFYNAESGKLLQVDGLFFKP